MGRAAHFDCFSGASGDMLLGSLLDAGLSLDALRAGLAALPVGGWRLDAEKIHAHGLPGTRAKVILEEVEQPHRGLSDVLAIVAGGQLPSTVHDQVNAVFTRLAEVEALIHATTVDDVHFHEIGAVDAIVDITGVILGLFLLDITEITSSALPTGSGWVRSQHGPLPVPAPATLELLRRANAPLRRTPTDNETGELLTPTGAALLTTLATFEAPKVRHVDSVGYGFGSKQLPWANAVRLWLGPTASTFVRDEIVQIETNLDDATPEELGFAMELLLEAGALDVAFSPLQMKKNRPGTLVRVLTRPEDASRLAAQVLAHTSALGVRIEHIERLIARRSSRTVMTTWGEVRVKVKQLPDRDVVAPEYEDCARLARAAGVSLREVFEAARLAANA